jgi:hypothetical protein
MAKKAAKTVKKLKKQASSASRRATGSAKRASSGMGNMVEGLTASMKASYRSNFLRKSR